MDFEQQMNEKGWTRQKHTLPTQKREEYRYHKDGSEITQHEAIEIFQMGCDNHMR